MIGDEQKKGKNKMYECMPTLESILFADDDLKIMTLSQPAEKYYAYKLRKKIFCDELNWVNNRDHDIEVDDYDAYATLIGVLDATNKLLGTLRIIPAGYAMMIEKEFACLIKKTHQIIKSPRAAEISRLCIRKSIRHNRQARVSHALYKGAYNWCLRNTVQFLYVVVGHKMLRHLRLVGFPCQSIGPILPLAGGYLSMAAMVDLNKLDKAARLRFTVAESKASLN
jgi:N-acyl-L-homoserine lactone synthetase